MPRFFIKLQYDGSPFHGWQSQINAVAVQDLIEDSLLTLIGKKTSVVGCGRTDTGVHATEYFAHFDYSGKPDNNELAHRLNAILPTEIAISKIIAVKDECHARYDAISRSYIYKICQDKQPFLNNYSWLKNRMPDLLTLQSFADILPEFDNFKAFAKKGGNPGSYICKVSKAEWIKNDGNWEFHITANRFLRGMVRSIIGTMLEAAQSNWTPEYFREIGLSKDRSETGASVPAKGLHLVKIVYPYIIQDEFAGSIFTNLNDGK